MLLSSLLIETYVTVEWHGWLENLWRPTKE